MLLLLWTAVSALLGLIYTAQLTNRLRFPQKIQSKVEALCLWDNASTLCFLIVLYRGLPKKALRYLFLS